ncbi:S8 family serine peptidase [Hyalangium versicolor]|uniref:S8 family serine peptidase n=1 Tax=Hyalangium versicolor TaxID=2861190 RepID=UPI001CCC0A58|nr:S8 family serine peptidase [Hyalangium versicolor]
MKRWVCLGLVGFLAACSKDPEPPVEDQDCTSGGSSGSALPGVGLYSQIQSQASDPTEASDGREAVLIRYRRTVSTASAAQSAADAVTRVGGLVKARWAHLGSVAARVTPEQRAELARDPDVLRIENDRPVHAFDRQPVVTAGTVGEYTDGLKQVQAPAVWDANNDGVLDTGAPIGTGIRVCVIDSGWDDRQPELKAAYAGGYDFVEDDENPLDKNEATGEWGGGHGTHTAATIVAQLSSAGSVNPGDEPNGVVGVAPGVELLVARVLNTKGNGNTADIISALKWCQTERAKIVSLSLGAEQPSEEEEAAFQVAIQAGILPIAASGNSATGDAASDAALGIAYPAGYDGVLAVGAVNFEGVHANFSQIGPQLSLVAPGVDVLSAMIVGAESYSQVSVDGRSFESRSLAFAPLGEYSGTLLSCGLGDSRSACGTEATCNGFVAYVDRGGMDAQGNGLTFAKKVDFMRRAGARAVIIGNNDPVDGIGNFTLGSAGTWVPTASVANSDVAAVKGLRGKEARLKLIGVDYARLSGTSMATPHVSGVAAVVWSARPSLTASQVRMLLEDSAKDLGTPGRDSNYGYGLVQAQDALTLLRLRYPGP